MVCISDTIEESRRALLQEFCDGLKERSVTQAGWERYARLLETVLIEEVLFAVEYCINRCGSLAEVKPVVSRLINSVSNTLMKTSGVTYPAMSIYSRQNREIAEGLDSFRSALKRLNEDSQDKDAVQAAKEALEAVSKIMKEHYRLLQNRLFPLFERQIVEHSCTALMWEIEDDALSFLSACLKALQGGADRLKELNSSAGGLLFSAKGLIFREEYVLYPLMLKYSRSSELEAGEEEPSMAMQTLRFDESASRPFTAGELSLLTKALDLLPLDITLIDADDKVLYFNFPEHRFFPRTPEIIGRDVRKCHPPKSLHIVERILSAFKEKRHRSAEFSIKVGDAFLLITYKAVYDREDEYLGVVEILQDIAPLRGLDTERRILDWEG